MDGGSGPRFGVGFLALYGLLSALTACSAQDDLRSELRTFLLEADDERLGRMSYLMFEWPASFAMLVPGTTADDVRFLAPEPRQARAALLETLNEAETEELEILDWMLRGLEGNEDYLACFEEAVKARSACVDRMVDEAE